jgi:hypothetical protein
MCFVNGIGKGITNNINHPSVQNQGIRRETGDQHRLAQFLMNKREKRVHHEAAICTAVFLVRLTCASAT